METYSTILVLLIAALLVRELRAGNAIAASEPSVDLQPGERFRTLRMQMLEPVLALVVVGAILLSDLERTPTHALVAAVGAAAGCAFGWYRARSTYVASHPAHRGVVLRYSVESFVALALLVAIKIVAEQDLLPDGGAFRAIVAALLGFILVESLARVVTLVLYFRRAEASAASAPLGGASAD
ncbi:hypothetical protein [Demequina iriomotensis]|uniref:hypothetical protein n=1 Tax=Demequina iriomotensis TaxID=1536641 RepID=UPI000785D271|nr:hypothetical protein [Demequina iriomotensis]